MIAAGELAPEFGATAVFSQRPFSVQAWRGQPILFLFVDYRTASQTQDIAQALRRIYPQHTTVLLVIVVDLHGVPRLMRGVAQAAMETALGNAARQIPEGYDPADQLMVLPDWDGKLCRAYGVQEVGREMAFVLVDGNGRVHATYQGLQGRERALTMVRALLDNT